MDKLIELRRKIDKLDGKIIKLFEKRFEISGEIGKIKRQNGYEIEDKQRENKIIKNRTRNSKLPKKFTISLFNLIFKESKFIQDKK